MDHSYFSWAFVPRDVKELDALTILLTVCRIKQSRAPHAQHLGVWERPLLAACSHLQQSSLSLDASQPVAAVHPMLLTPHTSQVVHKGTVTWEWFSAAVSQSLMMLP